MGKAAMPRSFIPHRLVAALALAAGAVVLGGCAATAPKENLCADYNARVRGLRTMATYARTGAVPDAGNSSAPLQVTGFRLSSPESSVRPCAILVLNKELVLHAKNPVKLPITEVREFYAENGKLITTRSDNLRGQFPAAGQYKGEAAIPIPPGAPAGKYRILVRLTADGAGGRKGVNLATAETSFVILPAN
jgi:hypothetical protein